MSQSLDNFAHSKLEDLEARKLKRNLVITKRGPAAMAERQVANSDRRQYISFCCNDYLNFNHRPEIIAASIAALQDHGAGAGASRLITGNHPLVDQLELELARFKGTESAVVFGSGYLANLGIVPTLAGTSDIIFVDELAHACLNAGSALSKAKTIRFRHNDTEHLKKVLSEHRSTAQNALILTDGVFSMDGDLAPLNIIAPMAREYDAWLLTDDAHGIGVVGGGHGSTFAFGNSVRPEDVPLQMGTLSKAIGSTGGYLCASKKVIDLIKTRSRTFIYSTGLAPAAAGAALEALRLIRTHPELCAQPIVKATFFSSQLGLPTPHSPIVPLIIGDAASALTASQILAEEGFLVTAIRPPTVPKGTARLRFTFSADHNDSDILQLANIVRKRILPLVIK